MSGMSRKDYRVIADVLVDALNRAMAISDNGQAAAATREVIYDMARTLNQSYVNFDRRTFLDYIERRSSTDL